MNTLEAVIALNNSKDFIHLTTLIYLLTAVAMVNSGIYWLLKILFIFLLIKQFSKIYKCPKPSQLINHLCIKPDNWEIHLISGQILEFETAQPLIDTGLFQLIAFKNSEKRRKTILIFRDQLSQQQFYTLQRRLHQ